MMNHNKGKSKINTPKPTVTAEHRILEPCTDVDVARKLLNLRERALTKGFEFDMSLNKVRRVLNAKRCVITNKPIYRYNKPDGASFAKDGISFDRYDNSKGYTDDNVIAVSNEINLKKGDLSLKEILQIAKLIEKRNKKKK